VHPVVVLGDARDMHEVPDQDVALIVTSPPYWQLKDYGTAGQLGYDQDYETYLAGLAQVWTECVRTLRPGGVMVVNLGDQYTRAKTYGRYRVLPIRERVLAQLLDLDLEHDGTIIWRKVSTMNSTGGGAVMGSYPFPRNGILKLDYEFLLVCRKPGPRPPVPQEPEVQGWFTGHWIFPGERMAGHHAMFPLTLPSRCVRMYTQPGDRVLDPFAGSGTTLSAAHKLGRQGLGYELNADFQPLFEQRVGAGVCRFQRRDDAHRTRETAEPAFFGSAVALDQVGRPRHADEVRVTAVTGPLDLALSDGRRIRLEGLAPPVEPGPCEARLRELTLNKAVRVETTGEGRGYVRLRNRTLINSRLLREGLAPVDPQAQHRNRTRFLRYAAEI
jgi:modification methylase